jgi:hypothetical protein
MIRAGHRATKCDIMIRDGHRGTKCDIMMSDCIQQTHLLWLLSVSMCCCLARTTSAVLTPEEPLVLLSPESRWAKGPILWRLGSFWDLIKGTGASFSEWPPAAAVVRLVRRGRCSSRSWHASCAVGRLRLLLLCSCSFHLQLLQQRNQSAHVDVMFMVRLIQSTLSGVGLKGRSKQVLAVRNEGTNHAKAPGGGPTNEHSGNCCLANVRASITSFRHQIRPVDGSGHTAGRSGALYHLPI